MKKKKSLIEFMTREVIGLEHEYIGNGVRYDWFDRSRGKSDNEKHAVTAFLNPPLNNGVQLIAKYQNRSIKQGLVPDKTINAFQLRFIVIW